MSESDLPRAILDACVLYPPGLRNLFMWLAVEEVFVPKWTDDIHEEWISNTLEADAKKNDPPRLSRVKLERTRQLMDENSSRSLVTGYKKHIPSLTTMRDQDDRHVLAAAIESESPLIVTFNLRDFPASVLSPYGVEAIHLDSFLCDLFDENPSGFMKAVSEMLSALKNPPRPLAEQCASFRRLGLTQLTNRLKKFVP
jgi:predicted nucleic acid-binding protein